MVEHVCPVLKGEGIYLDPFRVDDITEEYINWLNDPEVNHFLDVRFVHQTRETVIAYVNSYYRDTEKYIWAIKLLSDRTIIGTITLALINRFYNSGGIGIMIGNKKYWGKGAASEALNLVMEYAFDSLGLHRLFAHNVTLNLQSNFLLRKAGFFHEGTARQAYRLDPRSSTYVDGFDFSILADEWRERRKMRRKKR